MARGQPWLSGCNYQEKEKRERKKIGLKTVTKWSHQNPGSIPHLGNTAKTNSRISIRTGPNDLQAAFVLTQWPRHPNLWLRALGYSGPGATADDPRYPSSTGEPWPLNPTSSQREQVGCAAGQLKRNSESAQSLQFHNPERSSPWPEGVLGEDLANSNGVKCKSSGLSSSHRKGMWTTCIMLELHKVASSLSAFREEIWIRGIGFNSTKADSRNHLLFEVSRLELHLEKPNMLNLCSLFAFLDCTKVTFDD